MLRIEAGGQEIAAGRREQQARDYSDAGVERAEREQCNGGLRNADDGQDEEVERSKERLVHRLLARHARSPSSVRQRRPGRLGHHGPIV